MSRSILLVDDDPLIRAVVGNILLESGFTVSLAADGTEAWGKLAESTPDLMISDVMMPAMDGLVLLDTLRKHPLYRRIPVILLTSKGATEDVVRGLELGADDYLLKPVVREELLARVRSKLARPPVPAEDLAPGLAPGVVPAPELEAELEREVLRYRRGGVIGSFAYLELNEWARVAESHGIQAVEDLGRQVGDLLVTGQRPLQLVGRARSGRFLILFPNTTASEARTVLEALSRRLVAQEFRIPGARGRVTPAVGFVTLSRETDADEVRRQAEVALAHASRQLDLVPVQWTEELDQKVRPTAVQAPAALPGVWSDVLALTMRVVRRRVRLPFQIFTTLVLGVGLPFVAYYLCGRYWVDISGGVYLVVVAILLVTAFLIWIEGILASKRVDPPPQAGPCPPASAIIAAYLPNEAFTVVETVESFLTQEYAGGLQVILAYNTPQDLPIEEVLREMAQRDPRFLPLRVPGSTSKAQNVNAAMAEVTGEFVGVFDADHHPDPGSFQRAWGWLSNGWDVVQGRCTIRNGDASWVARTVAIEFEQMYGVTHPGRARLHGFGIFGGSNGYWRTELLRATRMRSFMLTEDIDSSIRTVESGSRIASDPYLISRELGPVTFRALWNQRLRWAQGWFQVSVRWLRKGLRSPHLSLSQKAGLFHLLFWREIYTWTAVQIIPILAYWIATRENVSWVVPIFVFTTVFTLSSGPGGIFFTYRLALPEIRKHPWWFLRYYFVVYIPYAELKTLIGRVAQLKELMGEEEWRVTPRRAGSGPQGASPA